MDLLIWWIALIVLVGGGIVFPAACCGGSVWGSLLVAGFMAASWAVIGWTLHLMICNAERHAEWIRDLQWEARARQSSCEDEAMYIKYGVRADGGDE